MFMISIFKSYLFIFFLEVAGRLGYYFFSTNIWEKGGGEGGGEELCVVCFGDIFILQRKGRIHQLKKNVITFEPILQF